MPAPASCLFGGAPADAGLVAIAHRVSGDDCHKNNGHVPFERSYPEREMQLALGAAGTKTSSPDSTPPSNVYGLRSVIEHRGEDKEGHYVAACLSNKAEGGWMVYNDDRCYARTWKEVSRMKATMLIYEKQAAGRIGTERTRLDFSHGSVGATCSRRSSQVPASSKPAMK